VKFIGYQGISYCQVITNPMPRSDKDMLYWLDKIDKTERKLISIRKFLVQFDLFYETLSEIERLYLSQKWQVFNLADNQKNEKISTMDYARLNRLIRAWIAFYHRR
jgi:hypothetical protein